MQFAKPLPGLLFGLMLGACCALGWPSTAVAADQGWAQLVPILFQNVHGKIKVGEAQIAWGKPIVLKDFVVEDEDGNTLLQIDEFALERNMQQLLLNPRDRGPIHLTNPRAFVSFRGGRCNFQDVLGDWWEAETRDKDLTQLQVEIKGGHLHLVDVDRDWQTMITPVEFHCLPKPGAPQDRSVALVMLSPFLGAQLELQADFSAKARTLSIEKLALQHDGLEAGVILRGKAHDPQGQLELELAGVVQYDLAQVAARFLPEDADVELVGAADQPLEIRVEIDRLVRELSGSTALLDRLLKRKSRPAPKPVALDKPQAPDAVAKLKGQPPVQIPAGPPSVEGLPPVSGIPPARGVPPAQGVPPPPGPGQVVVEELSPPVDLERALSCVTVRTSASWERMRFRKMRAGPAVIPITLLDGSLTIGPTACTLNDGRWTIAAEVVFRDGQPVLTLPKGPLFEVVQLTPEMCHNALVYISPLAANAGNVQGAFSVFIEHAAIPLRDPAAADVAGTLHVHGVGMDLSPTLAWFATKLGVGPHLRLLDNAVTNIHLREGFIHHEGFGIALGDKQVYTNGVIGLDHSLDVIAEVALPLSFLPDGPLGQKLKGTRVRMPIQGTLEKPELGNVELPDLGGAINLTDGDGALANFLRNLQDPGAGRPIGQGGIIDRLRNRRVFRPGP